MRPRGDGDRGSLGRYYALLGRCLMVPRFDEIVSYTLDMLPVVEPILIITFGLFLAGMVLSFVRRWFGNSPMPFFSYEPREGEITHPYGGSDVGEDCGKE